MKNNIDVCIATFQRPYKIKVLMEQFKRQTCKDFNVSIWNNSGEGLDINFKEMYADHGITVTEYRAGTNIGSQARFRLVPLTKGAETIIFLDDDEEIEDDFIEYHKTMLEKYGKNCILGWYSKVFHKETYKGSSAVMGECGQLVDYIGTGGMVMSRELFDKEPSLQNIPPQYAKAEDLYLSAIARKKGMEIRRIEAKCKIINDNKDQCSKLGGYKQNAFIQLRKEGWKLIKDMDIKIYTTLNCSHCEEAKEWFKNNKYDYEVIDMTNDKEVRDSILKETGMIAAPVIKIGEDYLLGFSKEMIETTIKKNVK